MKTALVTGAAGFLGKHLVASLSHEGYQVTTLGSSKSKGAMHLTVDIRNPFTLPATTYDLVVHAAGKAHVVPRTPAEADEFFQVNHVGTQHLLAALTSDGGTKAKHVIFISTVAVYGQEFGDHLSEQAELLAKDPYGKSKILAEEEVQAWSQEHQVPASIVRPPLVVGENPPGNLGAMIDSIARGRFVNIGGGKARRSMVFAQDIAAAIPAIAASPGTYNLTDGAHPSYVQLAELIKHHLGGKKILNLPRPIGWLLGLAGTLLEIILRRRLPFSLRVYKKMTQSLTFDDQKARASFGWKPQPVLENPDQWL